MVGGKSSGVDVSICIGIETNIDGSGDNRTNVLNSGPSGVAKEASRCNERGLTYGVVGTESGSEEVGDCIDSGSEQVRGCTDGGSKEVESCNGGKSKEVGGCTNAGFEEIGGCVHGGSKEVEG